jgi:hypothetical protein
LEAVFGWVTFEIKNPLFRGVDFDLTQSGKRRGGS